MKEKKLLIIGHPQFSTASNHNKHIFYLLNQDKINQILLLEQEYNKETNTFNYENSLQALLENDHIIFLHPIWWYSVPWTMKLWMDSVLTTFYNTHKETKKKVSIIITCGRTEHFYSEKNINNILLPITETYQYMGWDVKHVYPLYEIQSKHDKEWHQFATWINDELLA